MKKILCIATLVLGISPYALAQTHSELASAGANGIDHGSVRGVVLGNDRSNERVNNRDNERGNERDNKRDNKRANERGAEEQPKTPAQLRRVLLNCNDGSRHIARVCRRHGGIARDQSAAR